MSQKHYRLNLNLCTYATVCVCISVQIQFPHNFPITTQTIPITYSWDLMEAIYLTLNWIQIAVEDS